MGQEISSHKLDNGLTVQLKEIHNAPIISSWLWYRVGSRNETPGLTGISHWVEHMQFKGTPSFPPGLLDRVISREGGVWNAFTFLDWTTYFETMPAGKVEIALQLEADRMVNSVFEPEEVTSERTVIISEREGNENEPLFQLGEAVLKKAFRVHPYRTEIIGEKEDLHKIQRDDLYQHYRKHYGPTNAVVAIAGDFSSADMLQKVHSAFSGIPGEPMEAAPIELEPGASQEERVEVKGPGETTFLQVAYHAPEASHPDFFALTVLDSLLTGPSSLNMFGGGGISNKTSILYQKLVENGLAVGVHGSLSATINPYLYDTTVTVHPDRKAEDVLQAIDEEIGRLQQSPVAIDQIDRAIKQARALFIYGAENVTNQAFWLGYSEMFASYAWFSGYLTSLEAVTPTDLLRVACQYLLPTNRVVGFYRPARAAGA